MSSNVIPQLTSNKGWKEVPLKESNEPLVEMKNDQHFILAPQFYSQGVPHAISKMYVREGVYKRLVQAAKKLQQIRPGCKLVILDAWRPYQLQDALFKEHYANLWRENVISGSKLSTKEVHEKAQQYVSVPSIDKSKPAPHSTGGAVDLTFADKNGNLVNMGTGHAAFAHDSATDYFEVKTKSEGLTLKEREALENRRLLYQVMKEADFVNYNEEWWHFDYGNQFWAKVSRLNGMLTNAKYGLIDDLNKVEIIDKTNVKVDDWMNKRVSKQRSEELSR